MRFGTRKRAGHRRAAIAIGGVATVLVTLFPGESQTITVTYDSSDLQGATPVISLSGWNLPKTDIAAPVA